MSGASMDGITRRGFIAAAGLGIPLAVLEACAPATPSGAPTSAAKPNATGAAGRVTPPTYVAFKGQTQPDLPGNSNGLDPAYYKFPTQLTQTVTRPPGDGSDVSAIVVLTYAPPPGPDQNAAWQAVNKQLGVNLKLQMVPTADYAATVNTSLAGADIPDFIYNATTTQPLGVIPAITQFASTRCADLTPYLSGDAIKDYPNLANFSTYTWRSGVIAGKLYAVPSARAPVGTALAYRKDLFDQAGIQMDNAPKNADEFKRILQQLTKPDQNQWGIACAGTSTFGLNSGSAFLAVFRAPNNWKLDPGGRLVKDYETDEFKQAVGFARDLWAAGLYHPNTPSYGGNGNPDYAAGRFAVQVSVWGQYIQNWDLLASVNPNGKTYPMHPFAADGDAPVYLAGNGNFGITFIKQQPSPERVKMLLHVADFFAAPFGSQEWLLNYYGVKDVDYQFDANGLPIQTDQGRAELTATWRYITSPPYALFDTVRSQEFATVAHAAEDAMLAVAQFDPTLGLQSASAFQLGIPAQTTFYAGIQDIVLGRRPLSDHDGLVSDWRNAAGDKIRGEYMDALAAAHS
ncbi:MAG: extracellular solute-binding protein [Chloroflexi bacterium]|nr:extracellular solute-binding protein [Chloroflexota bacterium]